MTNCSKAAKPLAFDGEMDADADADGGDDGDGGVDAALEANVPCCNSPKREWGTTTGVVHIINRDLNMVYLTILGKGYASLTSGAADVVVTNADNLRMLRKDELLSKTTANLLLSMLRCRCAATR